MGAEIPVGASLLANCFAAGPLDVEVSLRQRLQGLGCLESKPLLQRRIIRILLFQLRQQHLHIL